MSSLHQFLHWFSAQPQNGCVDLHAIEFVDLLECGRGAVALKDLPKGFVLFTIPRQLTLSTRTSTLPSKFGDRCWRQFGLHRGWVGLILCMMWEESLGHTSKWHSYLSSLPATFNTPMFWHEDELSELEGTAIVGKIGKTDAERDFHEKLIPAVKSRPDIFPPDTIDQWYTLERYHIMGSRILSRSFQIEDSDSQRTPDPEDEEDEILNTSTNSAMDVDQVAAQDDVHIDSDDEDDKDTSGITMVPMADLLNARYGCDNARLFDNDPTVLSMITTKPIMAKEQIWNTYGDLPNSDLLRKYGHVDLIPLPTGGEGNPADIVEIPANLVVSIVLSSPPSGYVTQSSCQERIDWWLDEAGDDTFVVETDLEVPHPLISLVRLLLLSNSEWEKTKSKQKLPKPKLEEGDGEQVLTIIKLAAQRRLEEYPTTLEEDEALLSTATLASNKRNAVIVRLGEKRLLQGFIDKLTEMENGRKTKSNKRKNGNNEVAVKKSKR